jgi:hypothetical protein
MPTRLCINQQGQLSLLLCLEGKRSKSGRGTSPGPGAELVAGARLISVATSAGLLCVIAGAALRRVLLGAGASLGGLLLGVGAGLLGAG